ncbi:MAG: Helix-turn-helix domain [Thermomicrobiales bacterium]|jgi:excisionase family DNA binding protein|nr:Helix-turn-helix domain [Thermomicrobiales bacterium]
MDLLTVQETAAMLRVSQLTVRRYIASGRLAAIRVGRSIRVQKTSVEHFVTPVVPNNERTGLTDRPFTFDDPLWDIVGMIDDDGPTDVSINADTYLANAYADSHDN